MISKDYNLQSLLIMKPNHYFIYLIWVTNCETVYKIIRLGVLHKHCSNPVYLIILVIISEKSKKSLSYESHLPTFSPLSALCHLTFFPTHSLSLNTHT